MGRRVDSAVWDQRREWVCKQQASGLSVAQFCRENALNLNNFDAWKRRLRTLVVGSGFIESHTEGCDRRFESDIFEYVEDNITR